jgi:hypothetical protein
MARKDETAEIVLGEEKFTVRAPTLDQLQDILPLFDVMSRAPSLAEKVKAARDLVGQVTGKTSEALGAMFITPVELLDAADTIARITGLAAVKNWKPAGTG